MTGKEWYREKTGMDITHEHSIGKYLYTIKNNNKLLEDLTSDDPDDRNSIKFGTIESYIMTKLTGEANHSKTTAYFTGMLNKSLDYDNQILD